MRAGVQMAEAVPEAYLPEYDIEEEENPEVPLEPPKDPLFTRLILRPFGLHRPPRWSAENASRLLLTRRPLQGPTASHAC